MTSDRQENIEEEGDSGVVNPETPGDQLGKVGIDDPSSEQEKDVVGNQGKVTIDSPTQGNSESSIPTERKASYEFWEFPYELLETATGNFADRISEGYYGSLYRGTLSDLSQEVAVKLLINTLTGFSNDDIAKLAHDIGRAGHPDIVKFVGYCNEKPERHILVYEFIPTTLASYLHDSPHMPPLDWATRMNIIQGVANALDYLHNTVTPRVIYGDLDSFNILLDGGEGCFRPKLCGFGVGKLKHTGYCAVIHAHDDEVSTKCDILCFGLVLLELLTGRKAYDATLGSSPWLADWVRLKLRGDEEAAGIQDPALKGKVEKSEFGKALRLAMFCTHKHFKFSHIGQLVSELLTGKEADNLPLGPTYLKNFESEAVDEEEKKTNKNKKTSKKKN